jgi:hypothetical protein
MSFNSRTSKTWVFLANHGEEKMVDNNVATPEVHQRGGNVSPFPTKQQQQRDNMVEGLARPRPFKGLGNSMWAPNREGGLM